MLPEEILINIILSVLASIAFFYIYKKSKLPVMLLAGLLVYFDMLIRIFEFETNLIVSIPGLNMFMVPSLLIAIYMIWYTYNDGFKWIPIMIVSLLIVMLAFVSIGHKFYGDIGVMFALILIIWVNQSTIPCTLNPWECHKPHNGTCHKQRGGRDIWKEKMN